MKKGFTLVELLGVIVVLTVIFLLVFPSVNNIISTGEDTVYQTQINKILNATYDFSLKNTNYLPNKKEKKYITLGQLRREGLIDVNLENPENNANFKDNLVISIYNVGANYEYTNKNSKLEGDYLYTVEKINDNKVLIPTISLESNKVTLTKTSDNNYNIVLNIGEEFNLENDLSVTATSSNKKDLTADVKKYITHNNQIVDNISLDQSGVYKVSYSVVDEDGHANLIYLIIIIGDNETPIISGLKSITIGKDVKELDLLKDITCEDNSGYCDITTSGTIKFGVPDKYIIEYTAQDPSGNTITMKRVITVE